MSGLIYNMVEYDPNVLLNAVWKELGKEHYNESVSVMVKKINTE